MSFRQDDQYPTPTSKFGVPTLLGSDRLNAVLHALFAVMAACAGHAGPVRLGQDLAVLGCADHGSESASAFDADACCMILMHAAWRIPQKAIRGCAGLCWYHQFAHPAVGCMDMKASCNVSGRIIHQLVIYCHHCAIHCSIFFTRMSLLLCSDDCHPVFCFTVSLALFAKLLMLLSVWIIFRINGPWCYFETNQGIFQSSVFHIQQ
jgi:hypothetical protein